MRGRCLDEGQRGASRQVKGAPIVRGRGGELRLACLDAASRGAFPGRPKAHLNVTQGGGWRAWM